MSGSAGFGAPSGAFFCGYNTVNAKESEKVKKMLNTLLGSKIKMGQTFVEDTRVPVTYIKTGPCIVTQIKSDEKDGYWAVQLGFGQKKIKNITKPMQGHLKGAIKDKKAPRFLREVKLSKKPDFKLGDEIKVSDIFKEGDVVAVSGVSKGKGFAGVMKRWGFAGGPRTHGQSDRQRSPGSIGQGTTPGRVHKGKKMPGRMGGEKVTVKNLIIVDVDDEKNMILVSGAVPGVINGLLSIRKIASGKLDELVEEAPEVEVQEVPEEDDVDSGEKKSGEPELKKEKEESNVDGTERKGNEDSEMKT